MKTIQIEHVINFHEKITAATGGSSGIKDMSLIESALNRGLATFDGVDLYPSVIEKISAITHSLVLNHGFVDGNKRIGISVMLLLLKFNSIAIEYTQEELIELGLGVASGKIDETFINKWIEEHITK